MKHLRPDKRLCQLSVYKQIKTGTDSSSRKEFTQEIIYIKVLYNQLYFLNVLNGNILYCMYMCVYMFIYIYTHIHIFVLFFTVHCTFDFI